MGYPVLMAFANTYIAFIFISFYKFMAFIFIYIQNKILKKRRAIDICVINCSVCVCVCFTPRGSDETNKSVRHATRSMSEG